MSSPPFYSEEEEEHYHSYEEHHHQILLQQAQVQLLHHEQELLYRQAQEVDPDSNNIAGTALSYVFLFGLIFGLSATVEIKSLRKQLQNKFAISTGVTMQFLIMPILGFVSVTALKNQPGWTKEMGVALLVVTSSPGGSYSNWWCSLFNADLALSVAMTTVSSLLSMAMLPLNLFFYTFLTYGATDEGSVVQALDFGTIFLALGIVLLAISSGLYAGYCYDNKHFHVMANRLGSCCGILLVLFSLLISSGAGGAQSNFWNQQWSFYVGVAFPCLVGMVLANFISNSLRLKHPETVAIAIECCYQNTGIATSVAIAMYDDKELRAQAVAVPLFYGVVEAVAILIYCVICWKAGWTKAPASDPICRVLANTYEEFSEDEQRQLLDEHHHRRSSGGGIHDLTVEEDAGSITLDDEALTVDGTATLASHSEDPLNNSNEIKEVATPRYKKYNMSSSSTTPASSSSTQRSPLPPQPFWKRWFLFFLGGSSTSAAAANAAASDSEQATRRNKNNNHLHRSTSRSTKAAATAAAALAKSKQLALPALHEHDDNNNNSEEFADDGCMAGSMAGGAMTTRDRTYTVDTTASSAPPNTPATTTTTAETRIPDHVRKPPTLVQFVSERAEV